MRNARVVTEADFLGERYWVLTPEMCMVPKTLIVGALRDPVGAGDHVVLDIPMYEGVDAVARSEQMFEVDPSWRERLHERLVRTQGRLDRFKRRLSARRNALRQSVQRNVS